MRFLDCTLRDGANVLGHGFPRDLTGMILKGLVENGFRVIEYGNSGGIGAYEVSNYTAPLTDSEYLEMARPYVDRAEIGMFLNAKRYRASDVVLAAEHGLKFLRVGADAGTGKISLNAIGEIKKQGMKARYSLMKAYVLSAAELVEEAKMLEDAGLDEITIMDSAGAMNPDQVSEYTGTLVKALSIPVGFHGHNNLGLSGANALAAWKAGAKSLDSGLLGMARSAGNLATEVGVALMQQQGEAQGIDFYGLLHFLDDELIPAMTAHNYHAAITPLDLILGVAGCHSSFVKTFKRVAQEEDVDCYRLIVLVSARERRAPTEGMMRSAAQKLKNSKGMTNNEENSACWKISARDA